MPTKHSIARAREIIKDWNSCAWNEQTGNHCAECGVCDKGKEQIANLFATALDEGREATIKPFLNMVLPYIKCPACGGALKFGATDAYGEKRGCYSDNCLKVKSYDYYHITLKFEDWKWVDGIAKAIRSRK